MLCRMADKMRAMKLFRKWDRIGAHSEQYIDECSLKMGDICACAKVMGHERDNI